MIQAMEPVSMEIVNTGQILDAWMIATSAGRSVKMTEAEMNAKIAKKDCQIENCFRELEEYRNAFKKLEERCTPDALEYWGRHLFHSLTIHANSEEFIQVPHEPMKFADWLLNLKNEKGYRMFSKSEIKQIILHLLIELNCGKKR